MKVRIKRLPNSPNFAYGGQQPGGALDVVPSAFGGNNYMSEAETGMEVKQSLTAVPRDEANLEAEGGETAFGPISGDTIPDHFNIKGKRHSKGGVPLNLPEDTFIFSDTKAMRIKDEGILKTFGKTKKKGGYTPAELAKPYDINKYKAILMDPDTDRKERETAELMIKNYIMKLGVLALAQESKKGFPQGIPEMAKPYMEANGITEDQLLPQQSQEAAPAQQPMMKNGGLKKFQGDKDGSAVTTLEDLPSYKNATPEQKALFKSLTSEQREMLLATSKNQTGQRQQRGYQYNPYGQSFDPRYRQSFDPRYGQQSFNRFGLPNRNPFANRAFQKDFSYLTPLRAPRYVGSGQPFIGGLPNAMPTSIDMAYRKNPLFKSLFNKDIARKEYVTTYNYGNQGARSNTPGIKGVTTPFSVNATLPDFTKYNNVQDVQDVEDQNSRMSNRVFAREQTKTNTIRGGRFERQQERGLRRALNRGEITQEEFLALLEGDKANVPQVNDESNYTGIDSDGSNMMYVDPINPRPTNPGSANYNTTIINQPTEPTSKIPGISMPANTQDNTDNLPINSVNNRNIIESNNKPTGNSGIPVNRTMMDNFDPKIETLDYMRKYNPGLGDPRYYEKAFGGENEMLNAFVYGGDYAHGGFHNTNENYSSNFELDAADMTLDNPYVNTAENPYVNPLTGNQAAFVTNSETGKYEMTKPQEGTEGNPYSVEFAQKVNNAYTLDAGILDQQIEAAKNAATEVGLGIQDAKEKRSIDDIIRQYKQDRFNQAQKNRGTHFANNEGVIAPGGQSPTSVMSRMAEDGGSVKRVKILRKAQEGDAGKISSDRAKELYDPKNIVKGEIPKNATKLEGVTDADGSQVYYDGTTGKTVADPERRENPRQTTDPEGYKRGVCDRIRREGYTLEQAIEADWIHESRASEFAGCVSTQTEKVDFYVGEVEEAPEPGKKVCKCYKKDAAGNNIGEPISTTLINEGEPCPCEATVTTEIEEELLDDPMQDPRYSDQAYRNLLSAKRMRTNIPFVSPAFMPNTEMSPTLTEKYTSDITAALAGNRGAISNSGQSAANKLFMNLAGLDSALTKTGQRAYQTELANAQILNDAAKTNLANKRATDQINTATTNKTNAGNQGVLSQRLQADNAKKALVNQAEQNAEAEMREKAQYNLLTPEYQIDYRTGLPYKRTTYRDPVLTKPTASFADRVAQIKGDGYTADEAIKIAVAEKKMAAKNGGFIPRYTTMPFDR